VTAPEPGLVLRPAVPEEAGRLSEIYLAARTAGHQGLPPPAHDDAAVRAWWQRRVAAGDLEVWVAEAGGELVGLAALAEGWLDDLYVHPDHHGRGVGSALLRLVQGRRPEGFGLWVFAENHRARAFYARHGLVELELTGGEDNEEHVPDIRLTWPGADPLAHFRGAIDEVDDDLAVLLARRFALAAAVQDLKAAAEGVGGEQARDSRREAAIVQRMAALAPSVDPDRLARVMQVVLAEGLAAWHERV
jgi:chorismate mutase/GNAT superfamily N-acetyltransferase